MLDSHHTSSAPSVPSAPSAPAVASALDTSSDALKAFGLKKMGAQQQQIFEVVLHAQRNGAHDMSLTEIRDAYELRHGKRMESGRVSARVSELITARRLVRRLDTRACAVTGQHVHPVFVPAQQARLVA